jgi:hypothetical protein
MFETAEILLIAVDGLEIASLCFSMILQRLVLFHHRNGKLINESEFLLLQLKKLMITIVFMPQKSQQLAF